MAWTRTVVFAFAPIVIMAVVMNKVDDLPDDLVGVIAQLNILPYGEFGRNDAAVFDEVLALFQSPARGGFSRGGWRQSCGQRPQGS